MGSVESGAAASPGPSAAGHGAAASEVGRRGAKTRSSGRCQAWGTCDSSGSGGRVGCEGARIAGGSGDGGAAGVVGEVARASSPAGSSEDASETSAYGRASGAAPLPLGVAAPVLPQPPGARSLDGAKPAAPRRLRKRAGHTRRVANLSSSSGLISFRMSSVVAFASAAEGRGGARYALPERRRSRPSDLFREPRPSDKAASVNSRKNGSLCGLSAPPSSRSLTADHSTRTQADGCRRAIGQDVSNSAIRTSQTAVS
jgi:hypothetical protein